MNELEQMQALHHAVLAAKANISGSNDPHQIPKDATETLINGALIAGEGRKLGMSDLETEKAVYRMNELNMFDK